MKILRSKTFTGIHPEELSPWKGLLSEDFPGVFFMKKDVLTSDKGKMIEYLYKSLKECIFGSMQKRQKATFK